MRKEGRKEGRNTSKVWSAGMFDFIKAKADATKDEVRRVASVTMDGAYEYMYGCMVFT